ncbi:hypothetical protein NW841_02645, partial [Synechococcus sp. H60.3]
VKGIIAHYPHWIAHPQALKEKLLSLKARHSQARLQRWFELIDAQDWPQFVQELLEQHYDPTYRHGLQQHFNRIRARLELPDLSETSLQEAAARLRGDVVLSCASPRRASATKSAGGNVKQSPVCPSQRETRDFEADCCSSDSSEAGCSL